MTRASVRRAIETVSQAIALSVVVLAPVPFGSADRPWIALWCGLMGVSLALADLRDLSRIHAAWIAAGAGFLALWTGVALLQQMAPPLLGSPDPIWAETAERLAAPVGAPRVAAIAQTPWSFLGTPLLGVLVFLRMMLLARRTSDRHRALGVIRWAILGIGLTSYAAYRLDPATLLGQPKSFYRDVFTGTFVNANTAASYFGLALILWTTHVFGSLISAPERRPVGTWSSRFLRWTDRITLRRMAPIGALVACLGLVAATGSRAGLILSAGSALAAALAILRGRIRRTLRPRYAMVGLLIGLPVLFLFLGGGISERLGRDGLFDGYRLAVYRVSLGLAADHIWLGAGAGSFSAIFPAVRDEAVGWFGIWDRTHSTVLETAIEMGIPVAMAAVAGWLTIIAVLVRQTFAPGGPREAVVAGAAAAILSAVHSLVDFSLQTAGYLVACAAIVAIGIGRKGAFRVTGRN